MKKYVLSVFIVFFSYASYAMNFDEQERAQLLQEVQKRLPCMKHPDVLRFATDHYELEFLIDIRRSLAHRFLEDAAIK